jgi:hypothetical protein
MVAAGHLDIEVRAAQPAASPESVIQRLAGVWNEDLSKS